MTAVVREVPILLRPLMIMTFLFQGIYSGRAGCNRIFHLGAREAGVGIDGPPVGVEANGDGYPLVGFAGAVSFSYFGAQQYVGFRY